MDGPPVATASRSSHGLDGVNFFVAAVQTGFGSSITVYLMKNQGPPDAIGFALTITTLSTLFSRIPAGAALDSMREKRPAVLLGIAGVGLAALQLCVTTARPAVDLALAMQGLASSLTEDTDVSQIARLFSIHQIKRVPIVCDGRIACLVARADLLHVVAATQSQSTGEDKAKHRGFLSLFGEYKQPAWRVASVESPAAVPLVHARPRKVARQDRAAHKLHQLAAATNRPPPLTHGDASS